MNIRLKSGKIINKLHYENIFSYFIGSHTNEIGFIFQCHEFAGLKCKFKEEKKYELRHSIQ